MAQPHDIAAEHCGNYILSQIRSDNSAYRQIFSNSLHRIGDFSWPRPDYVCFDEGKKYRMHWNLNLSCNLNVNMYVV